MVKNPDVSIVVMSWNSGDIIVDSLESIVTTAGDITFDVTVIDDASIDGGLDHVPAKFKNDPRFSFVQNDVNVGVSALNIMLERTKAPYVMSLDSDARLMPGALKELILFMDAHPDAGAATANLRNTDGSTQWYYRRILTPAMYFFSTPIGRFIDKYFLGLRNYHWYHYADLDVTKVSEGVQPPIAGLIVRREMVGPYILDPAMPLFMCDIDLCKRLYDYGYKVYLVPDARVVHLKTASAVKRGKKWLDRELNRSYRIYFKKHYPYLFPLIWVVWMLDRVSRTVLLRIVGREPLR